MDELSRIIDRIESGEIGLEESLTEHERGVALIRRCRAELDRAEQRVEKLSLEEGEEASASSASAADDASSDDQASTEDDAPF